MFPHKQAGWSILLLGLLLAGLAGGALAKSKKTEIISNLPQRPVSVKMARTLDNCACVNTTVTFSHRTGADTVDVKIYNDNSASPLIVFSKFTPSQEYLGENVLELQAGDKVFTYKGLKPEPHATASFYDKYTTSIPLSDFKALADAESVSGRFVEKFSSRTDTYTLNLTPQLSALKVLATSLTEEPTTAETVTK